MKNKGLTLIELVVAITISGLLVLAMTSQFVTEVIFRSTISDQIAVINDASIAIRHMTRILRYAKASTVPAGIKDTASGDYDKSITVAIDKNAAGDNLPEITSDGTTVTYGWKQNYTLECKIGALTPYLITDDITDFPVSSSWWDSANNDLTLQLTATAQRTPTVQKTRRSSTFRTKIHILGE